MQTVNTSSKPTRFYVLGLFRKARFMAAVIGLSLVYQLIFPNVCMALTAGPSSPDFSSFEPVATTNMVNEFSGGFTYNLPVLEVPGASGGGYALSLSYHSGDGPESEASWVGSGWTLNPGCISRNKRGVPDDFKGEKIKYYNDVPKNWTLAVGGQLGGQIVSGLAGASINGTIRYNNYKGFGVAYGAGLSVLKGLLSLGINVSDGNTTFSPRVNPAAILSLKNGFKKDQDYTKRSNTLKEQKFGEKFSGVLKSEGLGAANNMRTQFMNYLLTDAKSPYNVTQFTGETFSGYVHFTADPPPAPVGFDVGANVSYSSQKNEPAKEISAYGYMYSSRAYVNNKINTGTDNEAIMDYTIENPSPFNKRDKTLPIPYSTPDAYLVSGEGIGGGFRMYNDRIGVFSPNYTKSTSTSKYFGVDVHLGLDLGVGAEIQLTGGSSLEVTSEWEEEGNVNDYQFRPSEFNDITNTTDENVFFRFNNDIGGKVEYDSDDKPFAAHIGGAGAAYISKGELKIPVNPNAPGEYLRRSERSSYIGYHTNDEIKRSFSNYAGKMMNAYERNAQIHALAGLTASGNSALGDQIGEIAVANEGGDRYVYGLPVYCAGDKSFQVGINNKISPDSGARHIIYSNLSNSNKKVGEEYTTPYASSYLLTQITTPDYVDLTYDGPTDDDRGGYTRFAYKRNAGDAIKSTTGSMYKWRIPYKGVYAQKGKLSDKSDDMGSYQSGYKEQYYLDSIITKTHFAVFVTEDRTDGKESNTDDYAAAASPSSTGTKGMKRLKHILLYAKSTDTSSHKLIKKVNFQYDYASWPGVPNGGGAGKLTLKKVWFEYNGIVNSVISPYEFKYTYPSAQAYPSEYQYIKDEMALVSGKESPEYNPYIDCWGNYQYNGFGQRDSLRTWRKQNAPSNFDHAAWQLKQIILPSGGEIHVQYEANTYSYVQDRNACAMVSIGSGDGSYYSLNVENDLGISTSQDKEQLVKLINDVYGKQKIYFKFFYSLLDPFTSVLEGCDGEYVDGYVNFEKAEYISGEVRVHFDGMLPREVCEDYVKSEVGGKLLGKDCTGAYGNDSDPNGSIGSIKTAAQQLKNSINVAMGFDNTCSIVNSKYSYLRIPVLKKNGGGVRVKRLLMYNKGIEANSQTLYGSEYIYDNQSNGTSYGVATNEPPENSAENPLVNYIEKRNTQSWSDKVIAGKDKEQFEGPVGMHTIPASSVGYSRIIKNNIHRSVATSAGYTVSDYYTVKDYPFDMYYEKTGNNGVAYTPVQTVKDKPWNTDFGILSYSVNTGINVSQGFCFIQNQMHGQIKQISNYPGYFDPAKFYNVVTTPVAVTKQEFEYFEPGEAIPMINYRDGGWYTWGIIDAWVDSGNITYPTYPLYSTYNDFPGKEMDITIEKRAVNEASADSRVTGDVTVGVVAVAYIPYPIGMPKSSSSKSAMRSIVVNKVVHYPAILRKTKVTKEGNTQITENVGFDPLTAKPLVTRTYDGYDKVNLGGTTHNGSVTSYAVSASSQFRQMGQKAWNERHTYYSSSAIAQVNLPGGPPYLHRLVFPARDMFTQGDELAMFHSSGVQFATVVSSKPDSITVSCVGSSLPSSVTKIEVIRSGYTNQLLDGAGGFVSYGDSLNQLLKGNAIYYKNYENKWRPQSFLDLSSYHMINGNDLSANERNYKSAGATISFLNPAIPIGWSNLAYLSNPFGVIKSKEVNYDTDGQVIEEFDLKNIPSAVQYGYRNALPTLVCQNSQKYEMAYQHFENYYGTGTSTIADGLGMYHDDDRIVNVAHTGKKGYQIVGAGSGVNSIQVMRIINAPGVLYSKKQKISFWAKTQGDHSGDFQAAVGNGIPWEYFPCSYVARSGEWALYEIPFASTVQHDTLYVLLENMSGNPKYIDDVLCKKVDAVSTCYVYDKNSFKLLSVLDDQHFAKNYVYNAEGKLIRKTLETERGFKTIEETLYNSPTKVR